MTDLKDLKELAEAAKTVSDGEWEHTEDRHGIQDVGDDYDRVCVFGFLNEEDHQWLPYGDAETNAAFIAAANPKTVLELIARVEAAEGALEHSKSALEQIEGQAKAFAQWKMNERTRGDIRGKGWDWVFAVERKVAAIQNLARNAVTAMGGDDNG